MMSEIAKLVGKRIYYYRKARGLTQARLADKAGVHHTYIGQIERGEKNATIRLLWNISQALEIPITSLFELVEEEHSRPDSIPVKCYNLLTEASPEDQMKLLRVMEDAISFCE
jgi:transcriptional regulator with XRE-family HTH domain